MELLAVGHIWISVNLLEVRLLHFLFYFNASIVPIEQRKISLAFIKIFFCVITCNTIEVTPLISKSMSRKCKRYLGGDINFASVTMCQMSS